MRQQARQVVEKRHPGFGVVYPDGKTGIRVVHTYTEGSRRIHNPDGSTSYTTPSPVIHELFKGGFAYEDGKPVTNREHLERISNIPMRDRALKWFDGGGGIAKEAVKDAPTLDLEHQVKPEPVYRLSSGVDDEGKDEITRELDQRVKQEEDGKKLDLVLDGISTLTGIVQKQGDQLKTQAEDIKNLKAGISTKTVARKKQAETMKAKWQDPEYRAKHLNKEKKPDGAPEAGETVPEV